MTDTTLRSALDACAFVDELGSEATGEIRVATEGGIRGVIFVERGRICWAAARGLAKRLTELLGARAGLAPAVLEETFLACKEANIPLGEHLVGRGVLGADDLRAALLEHTIESLSAITSDAARGTWRPRRGAGYSPRFTFETVELLVELGATRHGAIAAGARPVLDELFDEGEWAAAFVRSPSVAFPEPVALCGAAPKDTARLVRLGKWATSALDVVSAFSDPPTLLAVEAARGALVAFRHAGAVVAGETGAHGPARILHLRARARRRS